MLTALSNTYANNGVNEKGNDMAKTILKTAQSCYIVAGPRKRRVEGCCTSSNKYDALQFDNDTDARNWLAAVKAQQREQGFKSYQIVKARPITLR